MTATQQAPAAVEGNPVPLDYEFIVIGAGVCGLYQLYRLRELGVRVTALDMNGNVGGTWYRNRYPGCRFDSESYTYAYSFSEELLAEWDWSERSALCAVIEQELVDVANLDDVTVLSAAGEFDDGEFADAVMASYAIEAQTRLRVMADRLLGGYE